MSSLVLQVQLVHSEYRHKLGFFFLSTAACVSHTKSYIYFVIYHSQRLSTLITNTWYPAGMQHQNIDDIARHVSLNLEAEWEDRDSTVLRVARKSGGVLLWAELVVGILNAAILEGATQALVDNMILEMPGYLDGLYEWLLSTLTAEEKVETLALFQWAILASEPMRLDDIVTAVRVTPSWETGDMSPETALAVDPPLSFHSIGDVGSASLGHCKGWLNFVSLGLLEVRPESGDAESEVWGCSGCTSSTSRSGRSSCLGVGLPHWTRTTRLHSTRTLGRSRTWETCRITSCSTRAPTFST